MANGEDPKGNAPGTDVAIGVATEAARVAHPDYTPDSPKLSIATAAKAYHDRGLAVIPLRHGEKVPAIPDWQSRRLSWDELAPYVGDGRHGLGIVTGALSGNVAILDFDGDGWAGAYEHFTFAWPGLDQDHAPTVETGRGRRHIWLRCPDMPADFTRRTFARPDLGAAVELRGNRCQSAAPPSLHPSGRPYRWINPERVELPDVPFADLAPWLAEWAGVASVAVPVMVTTAMREQLRAKGHSDADIDSMTPQDAWLELGGIPAAPGAPSPVSVPDVITKGGRNDTLFRLACSLRRKGLDEPEIIGALRSVNAARCRPPLPEDELATIAHSAATRYTPAEQLGQRSATATQAATEAPHLTDLGNAERLVKRHGHELLYCTTWGTWLVWDGTRWARDPSQAVERMATETVRAMYGEAESLADANDRKALAAHAMRSEAAPKHLAMIRLAQPMRPAMPEQFDQDPWLLNLQNGMLDLRTCELAPHDPGQMITKLAPVAYDPKAKCPLWLAFLDRIMAGKRGLIEYLQMAAGYSLTGDTSEQKLFILYGTGANGKSTFLETLRGMMGDYGQATAPETLLARRFDGIPNDVAALRGARLVSTTETGDGRRMAEAKVKLMSGGDTMTARFMRSEFFEFRPVWKLWLATNHKPAVRGTDHAIWRRIKLIPFNVAIPEPEQDKHLADKLRDEWPGILAWALEGCLAWQSCAGLPEAPEVTQATQAYRDEMDTVAAFLADRCDVGPGQEARANALYNAYKEWCEQNGEQATSGAALGRQLTERGYAKRRDKAGNVYAGLAVRGTLV